MISRNMVDLSPNFIGTMATVYPSNHPSMAGAYDYDFLQDLYTQ
jgi:hypothetical protein